MASCGTDKYSGAGILIIDTITSSLLLVYDYTLNFNCCGGYIKHEINDPKRLEKTAQEELYEETRTLLSCDLDYLTSCPFVDIEFYDEIFRCYIHKITCDNDICTRFEQFDLTEISSDNDYLETSSMAFFPLKQFREQKSWAKIDKMSKARNRSGDECPLNPRVISVIKAAMKQKLL